MSWTGCEESTWWITWALRQEDTRARLAGVIASGVGVNAIIESVVEALDLRVAETVRAELRALPGATVMAIIEAWRMANIANVPFEVSSMRPESAMDLARRRSVRLVVDVQEAGVRAELSHIPSRHPTWQLNALEVSAASAR